MQVVSFSVASFTITALSLVAVTLMAFAPTPAHALDTVVSKEHFEGRAQQTPRPQ